MEGMQQYDMGNGQTINLPIQPLQNTINETTLVTQTNPFPLLNDLAHKLRGEIEMLDARGQPTWCVLAGVKPMMNELGVQSIMVDVSSAVHQSTVLSNYDQIDVEMIIINLRNTVIKKLSQNWKEFGCEKSNLSTIVNCVTNMAYPTIKRPLDQGERTFLKTAVRSSETMVVGRKDNPQDKKFWEIWK